MTAYCEECDTVQPTVVLDEEAEDPVVVCVACGCEID